MSKNKEWRGALKEFRNSEFGMSSRWDTSGGDILQKIKDSGFTDMSRLPKSSRDHVEFMISLCKKK